MKSHNEIYSEAEQNLNSKQANALIEVLSKYETRMATESIGSVGFEKGLNGNISINFWMMSNNRFYVIDAGFEVSTTGKIKELN